MNSFSSTSLCLSDLASCNFSLTNSTAFCSIIVSNSFIFLSKTSGAVVYISSYPALRALSKPNTSASSLLYAMYNNSTNSSDIKIFPFTPQEDIDLIVDCALVYNSENAIFLISSLSNSLLPNSEE
ncbi:hypothetical protein D3C72_1285990 [compost metagenome]